MANYHDIIRRVSEYAAKANTSPEAVCRSATNNPRLWPRLLARIETLETDLCRLEKHMESNPVGDSAERHNNTAHGNDPSELQVGAAKEGSA